MGNNILLLTLRVFSATGGIEKVCRVAGKAIHEIEADVDMGLNVLSMYDQPAESDSKYFPADCFRGFGQQKLRFVTAAITKGVSSKMVILSHVNLLTVGYLIKLLSPKTKLLLIAHGIEVWTPFSKWKISMLKKFDLILPVSQFTKQKMEELYSLPASKFAVLNNCLDPFLAVPQDSKNPLLADRYGIAASDTVLMSLTRLSSKEKYKGYDQVLFSIKDLLPAFPAIKYLIVGKYDNAEKARLEVMIRELQLEGHIIFSGFVPDAELSDHYALADVYIMPSQKEGFGIVFIEALFYGKPVIAGNKDGSVDALNNGEFGLLVNPDSQQEITNALIKVLNNTAGYQPNHQKVLEHFGYEVYKQKWKALLKKI